MPWSVRIGLALILTGIVWFGGWTWWESTRIWVPLDIPISLAAGHIRTPEFRINVESAYRFQIDAELEAIGGGGLCPVGYRCPTMIGMSWSVSTGGRVVARGDISRGDDPVGSFDAGKGDYVLDLDLSGDGSRPLGGTARVVVFESGYEHWRSNDTGLTIFFRCLILVSLGIYLIVRFARERRRERLAALVRSWTLTQPGPQPRNLRTDPVAAVAPTESRLTASTRVGAALVLAGLVAFAANWHWAAALISDGDGLASLLLVLSAICAGAGMALLAMGGVERIRSSSPPVAPLLGDRVARGNLHWGRRPPKAQLFSSPRYLGLIATLTLVPVWMALMVGYLSRWTPEGLPVHLLRLGVTTPRAPGIQPIVVQVSGSHLLLVNGKPVEWEDLSAVLQKEASQRPPDWPVYVEGDPNLEWLWVARAVDIVQGLHAKAYLLTGGSSGTSRFGTSMRKGPQPPAPSPAPQPR